MSLTRVPDRPVATPPTDFAALGPAHLDVTDRDRSLNFWRHLIGLEMRDESSASITLGTTQETLLVLHPVATVAAQPHHAGLYHVAIHLPNEAQFAVILGRLIDRRVPIRPTDHTMSKAIYLSDPDGLGVELTLETPERGTDVSVGREGPSILDVTGRRLSLAEPLDVNELLAHLPAGGIDSPLPPGTRIGHMHLQVSQLETARRFYQERLGFLEHFGLPALVSNLHAGGAFPHRLAINTFNGAGLTQAPLGMARLRSYTIRYHTPQRLYEVLRGLPDAADHPDGRLVHDPSGNAIVLTA
jgi:catechol 2,3-dioxygenase